MTEHLRAEELEQFKDAFRANDVATHRGFQTHLDECEHCRTRIIEIRAVEAGLRDAFVRAARTVTEEDVQRARARWTRRGPAVLLPVPVASEPSTSLRVRPLPVNAGDLGFISAWNERWRVARRITVGFVALTMAIVVGLAVGDALRSRTSSPTPLVLAPATESPVVEAQSPARELVVITRDAQVSSASSSAATALRTAAARSPDAEAGVVRTHRRGSSDETLRVDPDLVRPLLRIQPPYEFVQRVALELPPPLRGDFYTCVADPEAQQGPCMQTLGHARYLMTRHVGHRMRASSDSADVAWQRIQDRLYLR